MNKIGFIGAYDKTDLIIYIAKIIVESGKKVLIVDSTINQRAKYIVPAINPTTSYVTSFEGMDVAVGLYSFDAIEQYLGIESIDSCGYDYVLMDIDNSIMIDKFNISNITGKNYFVTAFDLYSLKKGLEILSGIEEPINLTKILYSEYILKEDDEYLNYLALDYKIRWNEARLYFPLDIHNQTIIAENQRIAKIKMKDLSSDYKDALTYLSAEILGENNTGNIKRMIKQM